MPTISPVNELLPLTDQDSWYQPRVALMNIKSDVPSGVYVVVLSLPLSTNAPNITVSQQPNVVGDDTDNPECLFLEYDGELPDEAPAEQMICIITYQWNNAPGVVAKDAMGEYELFPPVYLKVKDPKHKGIVKTGIGVHLPDPPNAPLYECNTFIVAPIMANGASQLYFLGALSNILASDNYDGWSLNNDAFNIYANFCPGSTVSTEMVCCNLINGALQTPLLDAPYSIAVTYPNLIPPPPTSTFDWDSKIVL